MQRQSFITLNSKPYTRNELINYCREKTVIESASDWYKEILDFIEQWLNHDDHIMVQTSGSTGEPKSIQLKKNWMEYSATQTCQFFSLDEQSNLLLCLPVRYIAGKMMIVRAITCGCNLITTEPRANPFLHNSNRIDFTAITPYQLYESLETLKNNNRIKTIIVGGGEIPLALEKQIQVLPQNIYATYGMTETSTHIALRKVNGEDRSQFYTIIGDTKISVDERGCLVLENHLLFDDKLVTNDIVEIINDQSFSWLGRWDNVINSGGIKLVVEDLEKKIAHLREEKMLLIGIPDEKLGMACTLAIEKGNLTEKEKTEIISQLENVLKKYELPKHILNVPVFPVLKSGKVDRLSLRKMVSQQLQ
jgi:o-succinylbenzoate---CoA ligase